MRTSGHTKGANGSGPDRFEDFVEQNFTSAYRFAFCLSLAHDRATRIVETTFCEAKALREGDIGTQIDKTWILETLHRKWRACHPVQFDDTTGDDERAGNQVLIGLQDAALMDCHLVLQTLHRMSPVHRFVLSLFYFEQLSYREIARILQLSPETALSRLAYSKILMRQMLEQHRISGHPAPATFDAATDRSG